MENSGIMRPGFIRLAVLASALVFQLQCSSETYQLVGTVERKTLELAAPVSEVITDIPVRIGDRVEAAQVLVQLDTEVAEAELTAFQAAHNAAQVTLNETEREFARQQRLRKSQVVSQRELDRARQARDEALALTSERLARVKQAEKRLADLTVRALEAGIVDQLPFETGERAPAGGVVAVVLADREPWVRVWIPARAAGRAKPGLEAIVQVQGLDEPLQGRLEDVSREPEYTPHYALTERERAHLVFEARIVLTDAPADLRPGVAADVTLTIPAVAAEEDAS